VRYAYYFIQRIAEHYGGAGLGDRPGTVGLGRYCPFPPPHRHACSTLIY